MEEYIYTFICTYIFIYIYTVEQWLALLFVCTILYVYIYVCRYVSVLMYLYECSFVRSNPPIWGWLMASWTPSATLVKQLNLYRIG